MTDVVELSETLYTRVKEWAAAFSEAHDVDVQVRLEWNRRRSASTIPIAIVTMGMAIVHTCNIELVDAVEVQGDLRHCDNVFTLNMLLTHSLRARTDKSPGEDSDGVTTDNWKDVSVALAEFVPDHKPCTHDWRPITHYNYWQVMSRESGKWTACNKCYARRRKQERTL